MRRLAVALAAVVILAGSAGAEEIKTIQTPRGVWQSFVYLRRPLR